MPVETRVLERPGDRGPAGPVHGDDGRSFGRPGDADDRPEVNPLRIGAWLVVGAAIVLFAAFTSTYLARRVQADWRVGPLPPILWANTAVLLASSAAIEWARRAARTQAAGVRPILGLATLLGAAFLVGQIVAWRELVAAGVYLASSPHADFFYLLTGAHAVHLAVGVGALAYALGQIRRAGGGSGLVGAVAIYWHFVDVLWLYIFAILFLI